MYERRVTDDRQTFTDGRTDGRQQFTFARPIKSVGLTLDKNSSGDEIANVNFFYNIAHVEASAYAH